MTFLVNPRVFHKILYGQQQQTPSKETLGKKRESTKETKLKMFLKRSSEPILNIQLAQITRRYGDLNLLQREIPNASVKMATLQQKAPLTRLWFHESKPFVTVQTRFRLEYRNCRSPSKNSIKSWYKQLRSESLPHLFDNFF
uniref:DUF4817 domain-containing protein n=2 Tax=Araneus ventricosus TaxID=182803 RepID=A0A4Y2DPW0_ARAVE|nr:hypothetical protein AVEN_196910-1 [Araneus ventricosus]